MKIIVGKKNRTEGLEGINWYVYIIQREIQVEEVRIVQRSQGVQIQAAQVEIGSAPVPEIKSNRSIVSEKEKIEGFQVNEKPN